MTFGQVWRRRHYRVKSAATPGTFRFSVLDNGVVSNEYWRIIDVTDDLSWGELWNKRTLEAAILGRLSYVFSRLLDVG